MRLHIRKVGNGFIVTSPDDETLEVVFNKIRSYSYEPNLLKFVEDFFEDKPEAETVEVKAEVIHMEVA